MQSKQATHRLRVRAKNLRDAAKEDLAADKDYLIAARFGMDTGAFSRLLAGVVQPSQKTIVKALILLPTKEFDDLFEIVAVEIKQAA